MLKFLLRLFSPPKHSPNKIRRRKGSSYSGSRIPPPRPVDQQQMPPTLSGAQDLKGKCYVIDGDTISIGGTHIRLAGIDAPELDQPWGKKAKFAMVALCKGQIITAEVQEGLSYNRLVAKCTLSDGTDLSAALVEQGLALDWPKYSGGAYRHLEPQGIRKKLWRVAAKHKGKLRIEN